MENLINVKSSSPDISLSHQDLISFGFDVILFFPHRVFSFMALQSMVFIVPQYDQYFFADFYHVV